LRARPPHPDPLRADRDRQPRQGCGRPGNPESQPDAGTRRDCGPDGQRARPLTIMKPVGRREMLGVAMLAAAAAVAGRARAAPPPKETGLSFEGLLKNQPGFQPRRPASLEPAELGGFLSHRQLARTYSIYRDTFARLLSTERALEAASRAPADSAAYARLRRAQLAAANSVLLHEFYFRNLAAAPMRPPRYV